MKRNRSAPLAIATVFVIGLAILFAWPVHAQRTASNPLGAQLNVQDAGTCSTSNSFAWQTLPTNAGITSLNLSGTFTATITVRESNNGGGTWTTITTLSAAGTTTYGTNGFTDFCADVTAFTSGIVQVSIATGTQSAVAAGNSALPGGAGANGQVLFNSNGSIGNAAGLTTSGTTTGAVFSAIDSGANVDISLNGTNGLVTLGRATTGLTLSSTTGAITISSGSRLQLKDQGSCTMAAGTCTAQSLGSTYTSAPLGFLTWTGGGTCAGPLKVATTTTTITPSSNTGTDTCVVNWFTLGN